MTNFSDEEDFATFGAKSLLDIGKFDRSTHTNQCLGIGEECLLKEED
jgi:hypothetical protein